MTPQPRPLGAVPKHRHFQSLRKSEWMVTAALDELCEAAERTDDTPDQQVKQMLLDMLPEEVLSLLRKHTKVLLIITR